MPIAVKMADQVNIAVLMVNLVINLTSKCNNLNINFNQVLKILIVAKMVAQEPSAALTVISKYFFTFLCYFKYSIGADNPDCCENGGSGQYCCPNGNFIAL